MKLIKFKQEYKKETFEVYVEKSKDVFVSVHTARYLFLSQFTSDYPVKEFFRLEGRPSEHTKREVLSHLKIMKIVRLTEEKDLFKDGVLK